MQVPKKDPQDDVLNRLRNSTQNMSSGKSRATDIPLDDKEEEVMGATNRVSAQMEQFAQQSESRMRGRRRRNVANEEAPLPDDDDDLPGAGGDAGKLREELMEVKAEKTVLEKKLVGVQADLAKAKEELEEAKDEVGVYEELVTSFTKQEEVDIQAFADMVSEWKGKAKAFDQAKVAMEKTKQIEKENADLKAKVEALEKAKPAGGAVAAAPAAAGAADKELQAKYEQAKKNLELASTKVAQLEQTIKNKDGEIAELKARLVKANASATAGLAGDEDPLIEMVEKLLKDMEEMAKESEEYLAQVEKEFPSLGHKGEEEKESEGEEAKPPTKPGAPSAPAQQPKVPQAVPAPAPSANQPKPLVMKK